jgi:hypothetical protein
MRIYQNVRRKLLADHAPPKVPPRTYEVARFVWEQELIQGKRPSWPKLCDRWNQRNPELKPFTNWRAFRTSFVRGEEATPPSVRQRQRCDRRRGPAAEGIERQSPKHRATATASAHLDSGSLCSSRAATLADKLKESEKHTVEDVAFCRTIAHLSKAGKSVVLSLRGRGQWFESTIAHHAARISPAHFVELPSYPPRFSTRIPRKVHTCPPSSYQTAINWR